MGAPLNAKRRLPLTAPSPKAAPFLEANALALLNARLKLLRTAPSPNLLSLAAKSKEANALVVRVVLLRLSLTALSPKPAAAPFPLTEPNALALLSARPKLLPPAPSLKAAHGLLVPALVVRVVLLRKKLTASECENGSVPY